MFFHFVTKYACDRRTDGRTDRQNYDAQDRASIAASRGKNGKILHLFVILLQNAVYFWQWLT